MKRLRYGLFITTMLLSLTSCGAADGSISKANPQNEVSAIVQTEETSEMEKTDEIEMQEGEKTVEKGVFNFETKTVLLNSGYEMPLMGLGTYSLDYDTCVASVTALLDNGGRLIDTAYMYHNEDAVGSAVRASDVPREDIFVTTKLYPNQYNDAANAIDDALEKMHRCHKVTH